MKTADATAGLEIQGAPTVLPRRSFWRSVIWEVVGLLVFVALGNLIGPALPLTAGDGLIVLGLFMSLVPAVLWLVFFYRADAAEPEPKRMVALVFAGGLILAAAAYPWLLATVYETGAWISRYLVVSTAGRHRRRRLSEHGDRVRWPCGFWP